MKVCWDWVAIRRSEVHVKVCGYFYFWACGRVGVRAGTNTRRPQWMTPIIGDIPFMNDALASIGVQGYTQVLFVVDLKPCKP